MGASVKTLSRFANLHGRGLLNNGSSIIELGTQELYCTGMESYLREIIDYFANSNPDIRKSDSYSDAEITALANKGFLGNTLKACGFSYRALDIFEAEATTLFDLNIHSPGDDLKEQFDLVTNLGTTEHVINQYLSMKTMHELTKPGGLIYHDLPMSGYHDHGYFSYNALLFRHLAEANNYTIIMLNYSRASVGTPAPSFMVENGYPEREYYDCGIECILRKNQSAPFRMPLETSTSLGLSKSIWKDDNPYSDTVLGLPAAFKPLLVLDWVSDRDLQHELLRRYRRKLLGLFKR